MSEQIPVPLPEGWQVTTAPAGAVGIEAYNAESGEFAGAVSVCEDKRNFELGLVVVKRRGNYAGRGWRQRLYQDAIEKLKQPF